jgi:hypothetical protein
VPPSVEKLALQGQVSNSPFLNTVPNTMDRRGLELPPKDYMDKNNVKEENLKCASAAFTMTKLNEAVGEVALGEFTATFGMLLNRHFREEDQIILIRNKVNDSLTNDMMHSKQPKARLLNLPLAASESTKLSLQAQEVVDKLISKVIKLMDGDLANSLELLSYQSHDDVNNNKRRTIAIEFCNPFLTFVMDAVRAAAYADSGNVTKGEMEDYCHFAVKKDKEHANDRLTEKSNITNLHSQVAALKSAVAETSQTEHDKKLRLRNLSKAIITQPNQDGTSHQKRENKDKREGELRTWLDNLFKANNFYPTYSLFIIDPKFGAKQSPCRCCGYGGIRAHSMSPVVRTGWGA